MAWNESHKEQSRQRILQAAAELFTRKGFNQVGIDEVMQAAGMTRGAFYAHFNSKHELYEQAIIDAGLKAAAHFNQGGQSLEQVIDNYLSETHLLSQDIRCPMACLVSDVAHDDQRVKHTYTKMLKGFTAQLNRADKTHCPEKTDSPEKTNSAGNTNADHYDQALLQAVLMIGGMAIARSITDEPLSKRILALCNSAAKNQRLFTQ